MWNVTQPAPVVSPLIDYFHLVNVRLVSEEQGQPEVVLVHGVDFDSEAVFLNLTHVVSTVGSEQ